MGDFRAKWGWAIGPIWTTTGQTADFRTPVFAESNTRPNVTLGALFYSNNTTNTTINDFNYDTITRNGNEYEGKIINLIFLDGSTRLANAGNLRLATSDGLQGANNAISLIYHNSSWIELFRSYNNSSVVVANSGNLGTAGIVSVLGNVKLIEIGAEVSSAATLRRATGGEQGQFITLVASGGSDALIVVNSAAADTFVSTSSQSTATQFRLASSAAISFIRYLGRWHEIRPVSGNSSGQLQ